VRHRTPATEEMMMMRDGSLGLAAAWRRGESARDVSVVPVSI
jgi:hypothetical protein